MTEYEVEADVLVSIPMTRILECKSPDDLEQAIKHACENIPPEVTERSTVMDVQIKSYRPTGLE